MKRFTRMKHLSLLTACFLLMTLAAGCSSVNDDKDEKGADVKVGDRVPLFTVETVTENGTKSVFSTERLTGETVIVLFHTSCGDCQRELPRLNAYYLQHCKDNGFQMVAISREENAESVAAFWKEKKLSIPYSAQTDRRIYNLFASTYIPRVYFCRADGIVTKICVEQVDIDIEQGGTVIPLD